MQIGLGRRYAVYLSAFTLASITLALAAAGLIAFRQANTLQRQIRDGRLRIAVPEEVRAAKRINQEGERIIEKAQEEAERIVDEFDHLIAELYDGVDWVLVEGFKESDVLKVEIWRASAKRPARYPEDDFVVAIATDSAEALPQATLRPVLDLNDPHAVVEWLIHNQDRFHYSAPEFL